MIFTRLRMRSNTHPTMSTRRCLNCILILMASRVPNHQFLTMSYFDNSNKCESICLFNNQFTVFRSTFCTSLFLSVKSQPNVFSHYPVITTQSGPFCFYFSRSIVNTSIFHLCFGLANCKTFLWF